MAFLFAIGLAFATENKGSENAVAVQGYIHASQPCEKAIFCNDSGLIQCTWKEALVFAMDGSTGCNRPLFYN